MKTLEQIYGQKTIAVTGANGFIGNALLQHLKHVCCNILACSKTSPKYIKSKADIFHIKSDYKSRDFFKDIATSCDVIFHLSGSTSQAYAEEHPTNSIEDNLFSTAMLIEEAQKAKYKPYIVRTGTNLQVGMAKGVVNEETVSKPITMHDKHQLWIEEMLLHYCQTGNFYATSLRLANIYGPGNTVSSSDRGILTKMMIKALSEKKVTIFGDGMQVRNYLYIDDVVNGILAAYQNPQLMNGNFFYLASNANYYFKDVIELAVTACSSMIGEEIEIDHTPWPKATNEIEKRTYQIDNTKYCRIARWQPIKSLELGLFELANSLYKSGVKYA